MVVLPPVPKPTAAALNPSPAPFTPHYPPRRDRHSSPTSHCADSSSVYSLSDSGVPRWSTLRFRRAKDQDGWVLLGIPLSLYPLVVQRLFEQEARFISKFRIGGFVNLLFQAPPALVATLAMTFPAPPGVEPLVVNEKGDQILPGTHPGSENTRSQAIATP